MKNPYNLPKKFSFIISCLNKLEFSIPKTNWTNARVVSIYDEFLIINNNSRKIRFIQKYPSIGIDGVIANRFNVGIYTFIKLLKQMYPNKQQICDTFLQWLNVEEKKIKSIIEIKLLEETVKQAGYTLVKLEK